MILRRGGWLILLTLVGAFVLTAFRLPMDWPDWLGWLHPDWALLAILFWALAAPQRIGPISAWIAGLFLDVLCADPLGLNALLLALTTHFAAHHRDRLWMYGVVQQCLLVFLIVALAELARQIGQSIAAVPRWTWLSLLPAAVSATLWLLLHRTLGRLKEAFSVG